MRFPSSDYDLSRILLWQEAHSLVPIETDPGLRALGLVRLTDLQAESRREKISIDFGQALSAREMETALRRIREIVRGTIRELAPAPRRFFAACTPSTCAAQSLAQRAWAAYPPTWHIDALGDDRKPGPNSVTIAVLDSGADFAHPSLSGLILASGHQPLTDHAGHGTHIASTICARPWGPPPPPTYDASHQLNFVPPGVLTDRPISLANISQPGRTFEVDWNLYMLALHEQKSNPTDILNLSIGGPASSPMEQDNLRALLGKNVLITAAAGNDARRVFYPAAYPECLSVAASTRDTANVPFAYLPWDRNNDTLNSFERQAAGRPPVDVYAPGRNIAGAEPVTALNAIRPAGFRSGTSMATAFATGAFGLRYSRLPNISNRLEDALVRIPKLDILKNGGHHLVDLAAFEFFKA